MYAVVRTGGKQYKVAKDTVLKVETLSGDVGSKLDLEVLMLGGDTPKIGAPKKSSPSRKSAARTPIASAATASTSPR
jgi:ribosomal protein L21